MPFDVGGHGESPRKKRPAHGFLLTGNAVTSLKKIAAMTFARRVRPNI